LNIENGYTFTTSGNFSNAGTVTVGNGSTFTLSGATLTNPGTLSLSGTGLLKGSSGAQTLTSSGTIEGSGNVGDAMLGIVNTGTILANQSTALVINPNSAGFNNKGNLLVNAGSTLDITGPANSFLNFNSSTGTLTGGNYTVLGTLQFSNANIVTNAAHITLLGAKSQIVNQSSTNALANFATNAAMASFILQGGQSLTTNAASFINAGSLSVGTGSTFTVNGGSYTQNSSGLLDIDITGTKTGANYGSLDVSGAATLDGTLDISLTGGGSLLKVGETFDIVTGKSVACGWTDYGLSISNTEHFQVDCNSNDVVLVVDSGALSLTSVLTDAPQPDSPTATPEPGSLVLLGTALLGFSWHFRRRLMARTQD